MTELWIRFQGAAAEIFGRAFNALPGTAPLKLVIISALLGVFLIVAYRFVSFQRGLQLLKQRITTVALEPFLFRDTLRLSLYAPLKMLVYALAYLGLSIPPLLILAFPVVWIMGLLNQSVGYQAAKSSEQLTVVIEGASSRSIRELSLSVDGEYSLIPPVRAFREGTAWSAAVPLVDAAGGVLTVRSGAQSVQLPLGAATYVPVLTSAFWDRLLHPGSPAELPGNIRRISIAYPERRLDLFGVSVSWVTLFLLVSMASGLMTAKVFRIQV